MERISRYISIALFAIASVFLFFHLTGMWIRISMDVRQLYPIVFRMEYINTGNFSFADNFYIFTIQNVVQNGFIAMGLMLAAQIALELSDILFFKFRINDVIERQILITKENETAVFWLIDRGIGIIVCVIIGLSVINEWVNTNFLLEYESVTRRTFSLFPITAASVGWGITLILSLIISYICIRYLHAKMKAIFYGGASK